MRSFYASDPALAARLEAAEAANMLQLARTSAASLDVIACESFGSGTAVFAGAASPMTHVVGLGFSGEMPVAELERMEVFFFERAAPCIIDLCPLAHPSVIAYVQSNPYRVIEFNNVLVRQIEPGDHSGEPPGIVPVGPQEIRRWARVVSEGFSESHPISDETIDTMAASGAAIQCWFAGAPEQGGAAMAVRNNVALFFGDAVRPAARRQGWQAKLIQARLHAARLQGADLAAVTVLPGSASHRNYERGGFELVYMRVNVMREKPAGPF